VNCTRQRDIALPISMRCTPGDNELARQPRSDNIGATTRYLPAKARRTQALRQRRTAGWRRDAANADAKTPVLAWARKTRAVALAFSRHRRCL